MPSHRWVCRWLLWLCEDHDDIDFYVGTSEENANKIVDALSYFLKQIPILSFCCN
jgi:hypothetical protein